GRVDGPAAPTVAWHRRRCGCLSVRDASSTCDTGEKIHTTHSLQCVNLKFTDAPTSGRQVYIGYGKSPYRREEPCHAHWPRRSGPITSSHEVKTVRRTSSTSTSTSSTRSRTRGRSTDSDSPNAPWPPPTSRAPPTTTTPRTVARASRSDPEHQTVQDDVDHRRRGPAGRLEREGHHPRHHREDRHGRRSGLRARIPRPGDPPAVHGGTHDDLQYVDRSRGARRNGR